MIDKAQQRAASIEVPMNVALVDEVGNLKFFIRMEQALLGSVDIAIKKATTAVQFNMNTEQVYEFCKPGGPAPGLENTNGGLVVFAGGIPLYNEAKELIGAIGVSGGSPDQDFDVASYSIA